MKRLRIKMGCLMILMLCVCSAACANQADGEAYRLEAREKAAQIAAEILTGDMSEYEKALTAYDWLCEHVAYDHQYVQTDICTSEYGVTLAGAMLGGWAVCTGYAEAYTELLNAGGIQAQVTDGTAYTGSHAWVLAKIDGEWYQFDPTWDDDGGNAPYQYFGLTNEAMWIEHVQRPFRNISCTSFEANYRYRNGVFDDTLTAIRRAVENGIQSGVYTGTVETGEAWNSVDRKTIEAIMEQDAWSVPGRAEIEALGSNAFSFEFILDEAPVSALSLDGVKEENGWHYMYPGYTVQLNAKTYPAGVPVSYESTNENVVTVTPEGRLTAVSEGNAQILISARNQRLMLDIEVRSIPAMMFQMLALGDTHVGLEPGDTAQMIMSRNGAHYLLMDTHKITYTSDDEAVAVVDQDGLITARGYGRTTVYAHWVEGWSSAVGVTVRKPVTRVDIEQDVYEFTLDQSPVKVFASIEGGDPEAYYHMFYELEWESSDSSILYTTWTNDHQMTVESGYTRYSEELELLAPGVVTLRARPRDKSPVEDVCTVYVRCKDKLILPAHLKEIGSEAFVGVAAQEIVLPDTAVQIGKRAFADMQTLLAVTIPSGVAQIADDAFEGCEDVLIYGEEGSAAQAYALKKGMRFEVLQ